MKPCIRIAALALCAALAGTAQAADAAAAAKPRIEKAADLPRFSYAVAGPLEATVALGRAVCATGRRAETRHRIGACRLRHSRCRDAA